MSINPTFFTRDVILSCHVHVFRREPGRANRHRSLVALKIDGNQVTFTQLPITVRLYPFRVKGLVTKLSYSHLTFLLVDDDPRQHEVGTISNPGHHTGGGRHCRQNLNNINTIRLIL